MKITDTEVPNMYRPWT